MMSDSGLSAEEQHAWRCRIFHSVAELGDLEHQRATWLDPAMRNPHYSFIEFFECFYDAAAGGYDVIDRESADAPFRYHVEQGVLSGEERDTLWPVHLALKDYDAADDYAHDLILNDPAWLETVKVASASADALRASLADPTELRAMDNVSPSEAGKRWP